MLLPGERNTWYLLLLADLLISITDIAALAILLLVVDLYTSSKPSSGFIPFSWWNAQSAWPVLSFLLLFATKSLAGFFVYRAQSRFTGKVATRMSQQHLKEFLEGPFTNFSRPGTATLMRRISHSPIDFCQHVLGSCNTLFTQGVLVMGTLIAITWYQPAMLPLLLLLLAPPALLLFYLVRRRMKALRVSAKNNIDKALQYLQESINGYVEANIYEAIPTFLNRYIKQQRAFNQNVSGILIVQGIPPRMIEMVALVGLTLLILIRQYSGDAAHQSIIALGAFMAAAYRIIPGLVKILQSAGEIHTWKYTIDELMPVNEKIPDNVLTENFFPIQSITFKNISFGYTNTLVFRNINLHAQTGQITGISGISGKGKTSLLQLLPGFTAPVNGQILFNGTETDQPARVALRKHIAYVQQHPFLLHDSLGFNITFENPVSDLQRLQKIISIAGLQTLLDQHPEGTAFIIEEQGRNISGGQRKRIALARALYKNAAILLLDEALNELDAYSCTILMQYLHEEAAKGKLILLISHHQHILDLCHKIFSLDASTTQYNHHY